jgi:hypothetical protein
MKLEFRKLPQVKKEFEIFLNSVKFSGTFSRISGKLAKIDANIIGNYEVECCKCTAKIDILLDQSQKFLISDGEFSSKDEKEGELVIEIQNHILDFDELLNSELESIRSDFYTCKNCASNDEYMDIEI